jgi:hypothetical protein
MNRLLLALVLVALFSPARAFGFPGEVFSMVLSGKEYCADLDSQGFSQEVWVELVSTTQIIVSFTSNFAAGTTFPMEGETYLTSTKGASFVGGVLFDNLAYATMQGTAKFDSKTGEVRSLAGTFIQNGVWRAGCFSSGKFKNTERLQ